MPTYIYETIGEPHVMFEIKQSMKDDALTHHPETGQPVRRVISGGYGIMMQKSSVSDMAPCGEPRGCCGGSCACGH